ncbi:MAG TPA: triose-phosphate isomerase [Saprospiraceae bacterium]|nr:triose-phosphate isomerase [Saprospiraceae bacterium]HND88330.1 triose-phosphate isomerase [Saprospiraceae bacterium]
MRQQIVAGNWKMNKTLDEGLELVRSILEKVEKPKGLVVIAPPLTHLREVGKALKVRKHFHLAAQNCHQEEKGAYTGEVSADMVASVGTEFVIIGHSERRQYFKEKNDVLAQKVNVVLARGMRPIFCCGEPLHIREVDTHVGYVAKQLKASLFHLKEEDFRKVVIAYEPIWAIGTGRTATSDQAQEMHHAIRVLVAKKYGKAIADETTILYGGSCNAQNAADIFRQPDVDGGLIGGASLKAEDFATIVAALK